MKIREAVIEDLEILKQLEKHIRNEKLVMKIKMSEIIIIEENKEIIGFLRYNYFWDEHPFMNMLFIKKKYRNNGYGNKLVNFWELKMKDEGHSFLLVSSLSNENAQNFYRKLNYRDIGGFVLPKEPFEIIFIKQF